MRELDPGRAAVIKLMEALEELIALRRGREAMQAVVDVVGSSIDMGDADYLSRNRRCHICGEPKKVHELHTCDVDCRTSGDNCLGGCKKCFLARKEPT